MRRTLVLTAFAAATLLAPLALQGKEAAPPSPDQAKAEALRIGRMVMAVDAALKAPEKPDSLETIARYGTDSRHYVMIRGWLMLELQGVESQWQATREPQLKERHHQKVLFLRKAIRRIDLE